MPTLFRLITVLGIIIGSAALSLYVLAEFVQPVPTEVSKPLRHVDVRSE